MRSPIEFGWYGASPNKWSPWDDGHGAPCAMEALVLARHSDLGSLGSIPACASPLASEPAAQLIVVVNDASLGYRGAPFQTPEERSDFLYEALEHAHHPTPLPEPWEYLSPLASKRILEKLIATTEAQPFTTEERIRMRDARRLWNEAHGF